MMIKGSSKRPQKDKNWQIKFSSLDTNIVEDNGNDSIAIFAIISIFLVERILVDDGSPIQVLMWKTFKQTGLDESELRPIRLIYDFSNQTIRAKGIITLSVTFGQGEHKIIVIANFLVVDQPSTYNAIIGRPLMKKMSMVMAISYLVYAVE